MRRSTAVLSSVLIVISGTFSSTAAGAAPDRPGGRTYLQVLADRAVDAGVTGIVAELDQGGVRTTALAGLADRLTGQRSSLDDHYRIASQTKMFVATLVLQLVASGQVNLDAPIATYLPGVVEDGADITVRMLLSHRSGLVDAPDLLLVRLQQVRQASRTTYQPQQLVSIANQYPLLFTPGSQWSYSNTNYIVLGLLVEKLTQQTLAVALQQRIFRPLHMTQTSYNPTDSLLPTPYLHGYMEWDSYRRYLDETRFNYSVVGAAGAAVSTVSDLGLFQAALFGGKLLPVDLLQEMEQPVGIDTSTYGYGLGLEEYKLSCGVAVGHSGAVFGYNSYSFTLQGTTTSVRVIGSWYYGPTTGLEGIRNVAFDSLCGVTASDTNRARAKTNADLPASIYNGVH